jgi:2'-5' RNA ligase
MSQFVRKYDITRQNGFRPVKSENMHLTLKFLGDATPDQVKSISTGLSEIMQRRTAFQITFEGVGAFPNWNQPRILWIGMKAPPLLDSLYQEIACCTVPLGFPSENRRFSPHLTLARVNSTMNDPRFSQVIHSISKLSTDPVIGKMQVTELNLYRSVLQSNGPVYSILSTHPFLQTKVV